MSKITDLTINTYNKIADKYSHAYCDDKSDLPYIDKFISYLKSGDKILDLGCGPGQFSMHLQKNGFKVTGIDLSSEMLKIAKSRTKNVDFQQMDIRELDFESKSFDAILAAYSLIHIPNDEINQVIKEMKRILKTKGYAFICVQKGKSDQTVNEPFDPMQKIFFNFFQPKELKAKLNENGFKIIFQELIDINDTESMSDKVIYTLVRKR